MKFKTLLIFPVFFLITTIAFAQEKTYVTKNTAKSKAVKFFKKGFEMTMNYKDDEAIKYFEKALKIEPDFVDVYIRLGGIYHEREQFTQAEQALEKVLNLAPDYQKNVPFLLGVVEMRQEKHGEAATHFQQYLDAGPKSERTKQKAIQFAQSCKFIAEALENPVPFNPENLGPNVNTENAEYLPSITADGQSLIFTRLLNRRNEDFFISKRNGDTWEEAMPMDEVNTSQNEGAQTISADGRLLVFTACNRGDGYGSCDLYFSEVRSGRWTPPANIGRPINTSEWESQPSLSADGKTLYFSSERNGGKGNRDIWYATRNPDGSWNQPINLPGPINTSQSEESPFVHPDNQTLYFMSNGHPGMGSQDLFLSRRQEENGIFGKPQNLGYPINTEGHEGALFVDLEGKMAYFSTDREFNYGDESEIKRRRNHTDIYQFELHEAARPQPVTYVKAEVIDANTYFPLIANVEFMDLETGNTFSNAFTNEEGEFLVCLPLGKDYALNVSKEDYLFHSENFSLSQQQKLDDPFLLTIKLQPIPKDEAASLPSKPIILKNVFFESGSAELLPASLTELNRLKTLLEKNQSLSIRINGHTDNVGNDEDNMTLSQNRAKAVYSFLISQGIEANRLSYEGFGETNPIDTNETEEGRQNNRRTEFEVVR